MTPTIELGRDRMRLPWAFVPAFLLLSSALGVGSMAIVAIRDPNFATEADYYQKAVHWDHTQAQAGENQRLSYRFELPPQIAVDQHGHATLDLKLSDRSGMPVTGARIGVEAFANAYSGDIARAPFTERAPGRYTATLGVHHFGLWEFRLSADGGADHFTAALRADLVPEGSQ